MGSGSDGAKMAAGESGWWPPHDGALIVKGYPVLLTIIQKPTQVLSDRAYITISVRQGLICA